ncbi:MAG TPA: IclR family transcriptional regulator [Patescibacteria group bacterium]|nr:IclR family transcriptional regulator [Patescibacteria group bacterium]
MTRRTPTPQHFTPVRSLERALAILDAFTPQLSHLTLGELAEKTGLPKPTVFRLANTLASRSYLERIGDGYEVGLRCFSLGNVFRDSVDLRTRALPHLIGLRDETGESVQLAVLSGENIVYVERVFSTNAVAYMRSRIGAVLPAYCTGLGKALLAFEPPAVVREILERVTFEPLTTTTITSAERFRAELETTRLRGYAVDDQEREYGVRCIAAPLFDHSGEVVAALSVSVPAERLALPIETSALVEVVLRTSRAISRSLGFEGSVTALAPQVFQHDARKEG